ncbi:hypothetical protein BBH88_07315 [Planococcus antarcticus DSM 14505]|uniref:Uncharacterized protein n=1 Tax=Planococcus antarcticus DSM 14505 TaxID=1185653 RepID=A0ABN4RDP2_9BACL|nr:hypothetical protein [Planococcus antarcticus]ANU10123.1 hypothetical protein BBH88_07315 [Planococcus antarcticus DSM 14505]
MAVCTARSNTILSLFFSKKTPPRNSNLKRVSHEKSSIRTCSLLDAYDETGYTHKTITNYLAPNFNPINGQYGVRRPGKLSPFRNEVLTLRTKGTTYKEIHAFICQKGYTGSEAAIRQFIAKEKRMGRDFKKEASTDATEVIERKWLIKLLYKPLDKVKDISFEQVENIIQKYPLKGTLLDLIWDFKKILKSGKKEIIHTWIAETESLELAELKSFLNGIKKISRQLKMPVHFPIVTD